MGKAARNDEAVSELASPCSKVRPCVVATCAAVTTVAARRSRKRSGPTMRGSVQGAEGTVVVAADGVGGAAQELGMKLTKPFEDLIKVPLVGIDRLQLGAQGAKIGAERLFALPGMAFNRAQANVNVATTGVVRLFQIPGKLYARVANGVTNVQQTVYGITQTFDEAANSFARVQKGLNGQRKRLQQAVETVGYGLGLGISAAQGLVWLVGMASSTAQTLISSAEDNSAEASNAVMSEESESKNSVDVRTGDQKSFAAKASSPVMVREVPAVVGGVQLADATAQDPEAATTASRSEAVSEAEEASNAVMSEEVESKKSVDVRTGDQKSFAATASSPVMVKEVPAAVGGVELADATAQDQGAATTASRSAAVSEAEGLSELATADGSAMTRNQRDKFEEDMRNITEAKLSTKPAKQEI
eukprot:TRINITY_DN4670_c0_g1_i1.p1 TRINITY_DN4670_c0_g1~~TRINITY_DN4670_c0_g1_i1.p1  ORF type:complete len:458 (-),score=90.00 TRINITY_DN4670_c0_g1_i1:115-1365(-)